MLQSLKHRGPDSTGYALYGKPQGNELVLRFKVAEQDEMSKGFDIHHQVKKRQAEVDRRLEELGAKIVDEEEATEYAYPLPHRIRRRPREAWPTTSRISTVPRSSPSAMGWS